MSHDADFSGEARTQRSPRLNRLFERRGGVLRRRAERSKACLPQEFDLRSPMMVRSVLPPSPLPCCSPPRAALRLGSASADSDGSHPRRPPSPLRVPNRLRPGSSRSATGRPPSRRPSVKRSPMPAASSPVPVPHGRPCSSLRRNAGPTGRLLRATAAVAACCPCFTGALRPAPGLSWPRADVPSEGAASFAAFAPASCCGGAGGGGADGG